MAGQMEGDGLPQCRGATGRQRGRRHSSHGVSGAARGSVEGAEEKGKEVEAESAPPREVQLPEECWVGVLRAGGVREMCIMGRVNR